MDDVVERGGFVGGDDCEGAWVVACAVDVEEAGGDLGLGRGRNGGSVWMGGGFGGGHFEWTENGVWGQRKMGGCCWEAV